MSVNDDINNIIESITATLYHQIHNLIKGIAISKQNKNQENSGPVIYNNLLLNYINQLKDKKTFDTQYKYIYQTYNNNYPAISGLNNFIGKFLSNYVSSSLLSQMTKTDKYTCFQNTIHDSLMTYIKYLANNDRHLYFYQDENVIIEVLKPQLNKILSETAIEISYKILNPEAGSVSKIQYEKLCAKYKKLEQEFEKYKKQNNKKIKRLNELNESNESIKSISNISNISDLMSPKSRSKSIKKSRNYTR